MCIECSVFLAFVYFFAKYDIPALPATNYLFACLFIFPSVFLHFFVCVKYLDISELSDIPAPPATSRRPVTDSFPGI